MNYLETISWLFNQFPAFHELGADAYNPGLKNTEELLLFFGNPHKDLRFIHIGGTNGKGSTSNYIASILQENELNVGLFTSPHILDFTERIRINGKCISEDFVIDFCTKVRENDWEIQPSFFEITWVMALCYFAKEKVDIVCAEVGLGGRLDATNVIVPELSIITNIGLDHQYLLGNTLGEIAKEKAGIIKENIPVIIGEKHVETETIFKKAAIKSPIYFAEDNLFQEEKLFLGYQKQNAKTILLAIQLMKEKGWKISSTSILKGIENVSKNTGFFGRFQKVQSEPSILVDCAHNVEGIALLLEHLPDIEIGKYHFVYGTSSDKDIRSIKVLLPKDTHYYFCEFSSNRSMKRNQLEEKFQQVGTKSFFFDTVQEGFSKAQQLANKEDKIIVFGSFFLVSDFFSFFSPKTLAD